MSMRLPSSARPLLTAGAWRREGTRLALSLVFGALIGWLGDHSAWGVCAALLVYAVGHIRRLVALGVWLRHPTHTELPEAGGLWGETFDRLLALQQEHRQQREKLSAMLAEYQASTAALPDGVVIIGMRGEITGYNDAAQRLLGLSAADVGLRIPNLIRNPRFADHFAQGTYQHEVEVPSPLRPDKTLSLRIVSYGHAQRLLMVRDVSELKRLETARRDFVANASHELRTPLTVLSGYLEMLEGTTLEGGAFAEWRAPLREMRDQARRMESLVADMLKLARMEATEIQALAILEMPKLIRRALDEAHVLSNGQHRFECQIDEGISLQGDEMDITSVLTNLLTNAVRYTPDNGTIRVQWTAESGGASFRVTDNGVGIAAQDIPRLTERFYRVDAGRSRADGGMGLGLSIVKHALERHGARLEIESELGVGSSFRCVFSAASTLKISPPASKTPVS